MTPPDSIKKFAEAFAELPGIGPRQALRLAFHLAESDRSLLQSLQSALDTLGGIKLCRDCFFVHEEQGNACHICSDPNRKKGIIAIVEKITDLISLERTRKFAGRYLILGDLKKTGVLAPEQKLRLTALKEMLAREMGGKAEEIILAINPTAYGDLNASMLRTELLPFTAKITRLARGIPTGGEIEFADEETLGSALEGRA